MVSDIERAKKNFLMLKALEQTDENLAVELVNHENSLESKEVSELLYCDIMQIFKNTKTGEILRFSTAVRQALLIKKVDEKIKSNEITNEKKAN